MIRRDFTTWSALLVASCICVSLTRAQDAIEEQVKKPKISSKDKAAMETEVSNRVQQLADAATPQVRKERMDALVRITKISGASPAGLAVYAELVAGELGSLTTNANLDAALAAILVVVDLGQVEASPALVRALASPHAAVRFLAARGIRSLHGKLKDDSKHSGELLAALGEAGAKEEDPLALDMIYKAVDFLADTPEFKNSTAQAEANSAIFAGRATTLATGGHNFASDLTGVNAASSAYAKASKDARTRLIGTLTALMEITVNRYFADETSSESLPKLAEIISAEEKAIRTMIQASKVKTPTKGIAAALKGDDRKKTEVAARSAMGELREILRGEPWKLP